MARWINKRMDFLQQNPDQDAVTVSAFPEQYGCYLMTSGRLREAYSVLEDLLAREREARWRNLRALCRVKAMLGETYRRLHE
jgi:hypothetical protein